MPARISIVLRVPAPLVEAVHQRLTSQGFEPVGSTPEAFASLIEAEQKKWPAVVRRAGLRPE
ncbi:hypothetical protein N234_35805 [Ralstonia pickettii DTP0602]|nr:hypothetical protein N234_35805 [Ralstonia pickettii DTP0602]